MDSIAQLCSAFEGTFAGQSMIDLVELYKQIEGETSTFCKNYAIACFPGCGTCCEHFMPDITAIEARLVAAYLVFIKQDEQLIQSLSNQQGNESGPCPLYRFDSPYHCSVYEARPLICRLFGACASQGKNGNAIFRRCRYNVEQTMPLFLEPKEDVPVMQDYAYALRSLDSEEGEVGLLPEMVLAMVEQMRFLAAMIDLDDSNPDDTPNPLAS